MAISNTIYRFLELKVDLTTDERHPAFVEYVKESNIRNYYNTVSGMLVKTDTEVIQIKDKNVTVFNLFLKDEDEIIKVKMYPSEAVYSLISSLAGINKNIKVKIEIGKRKAQSGFDFAKPNVTQNDKRIEWKIDVRDIPKDEKEEYFSKLFKTI